MIKFRVCRIHCSEEQDGEILAVNIFQITPGEKNVPEPFVPLIDGSSLKWRFVQKTFDLLYCNPIDISQFWD